MSLAIVIHPAAECMPKMKAKVYEETKADIKERGCEERIRYLNIDGEASVFDGRHRIQILKELRRDPWKELTISGDPVMQECFVPDGESLTTFIANSIKSLNMNRRSFDSPTQRATAGANLLAWMRKQEEAEKEAEQKAAVVEKVKELDEDVAEKLETGEITVAQARKELKEKEIEVPKELEPAEKKRQKSKKGKGTARKTAAAATGASPRNVQTAADLQKHAPDLFKKCENGDLTLNAAFKEYKQRTAKGKLEEASKEAEKEAAKIPSMQTIVLGDCVAELGKLKTPIDLIITDPPYNQGIDYGFGKKADTLEPDVFYGWCAEWVKGCYNVLDKFGSMIVIVPPEHGAEIDLMLQDAGFHIRSRLVAWETFGMYLQGNFPKCHRSIFYAVKDRKKFTWNEDAFLVESRRQQLGDKRANPAGKIMDSVIKFDRLPGNAAERLEMFPTQLAMKNIQPFIDGLSNPGDSVLDPFTGSGTVAECCIWGEGGQRKYIGFEKNPKYVEAANQRLAVARSKFVKASAA